MKNEGFHIFFGALIVVLMIILINSQDDEATQTNASATSITAPATPEQTATTSTTAAQRGRLRASGLMPRRKLPTAAQDQHRRPRRSALKTVQRDQPAPGWKPSEEQANQIYEGDEVISVEAKITINACRSPATSRRAAVKVAQTTTRSSSSSSKMVKSPRAMHQPESPPTLRVAIRSIIIRPSPRRCLQYWITSSDLRQPQLPLRHAGIASQRHSFEPQQLPQHSDLCDSAAKQYQLFQPLE
ncbi:MAG: hypothetical protein IPO31_15090 [Candidatus Obscuribacter sp.]|nr:hypothetical protein [Candidatus Obscuribacter sp.]